MSDKVRFDGRAILVTGAGRGMGRTHALLLASRGAKVLVADNGSAMDGAGESAGPAHEVVEEIRAAGGEAAASTADLATEAGANEAVEATVRAFGRIDGLLHNASTVPELQATPEFSSHDLEQVLRVNTFAGLWMSRAAWPHMQRQRYGRILFTTSVGIYGQEGTALYCAAKAAQLGVMRALALEGPRDGILVNVIAPSARTRMTEKFLNSAYGQWLFHTMPPEKISVAAAFLMSEESQVNGEVISLGGGRVARLTFAETEGVLGCGDTIEQVRDAMPKVLADTSYFYPRTVAERSAKVAALFGFEG